MLIIAKFTFMRTLFILMIIITCSGVLHAQSTYNRAIGIKAGGGISATYKKFISETNNLEAQVTVWNKGYRVSGLYEFNFYSFKTVPGLAWFVGPGVHLGFWKDNYQKDYSSRADLGIDGIIGLDYKFDKIPINVSVDWQPSVTLVGTAAFTPSYGGVAVRYTF